jgi:hypothetical protein
MHGEILSDKQREMLPLIAQFKQSFYLVGGTAIALHIGHRRSIDFDLFTPSRLNKARVWQKLSKISVKKIAEDVDQLHIYINGVKVTFFNYPYPVAHPVQFEHLITLPSLLSLAAMKAFALGRRAKWKDYVDLYFLLKDFFSIKEIAMEAEQLFGQLFSEKLFREQLAFHKDINYSEEVEFMEGFEADDATIKTFLIDRSLEWA